jgi:hypothetical protein
VIRLPERLKRWWRVYVRRLGETHEREIVEPLTVSSDLTLRWNVERLQHEDFESDAERVKFLFHLLGQIERRMDAFRKDLAGLRRTVDILRGDLTSQVEEVDTRLTSIAEAIEAGSVRLRTFGFACLLSGIVFATWAPELADSLLGLPVMLVVTLSGCAFAWTRPT